MYSIEQLQQKLSVKLNELPIRREPSGLYEPISYTLDQGGKRIRPLLVLLSNQMFGGNIDDALPAATAIEIFHNFTLLHDDVIDQAPLRRGLETVYQKWNVNVAILSGDTMFAIAYGELSKSSPSLLPQLMEIFTKTAIEVCEGQQYDVEFEESDQVDLDTYIRMIRLKTAALLASSLKIGAMIANAPVDETDKIYDFGINMGIAFQLQDDLLDTFGDQNIFGKLTGGDIAANKKTVLFLKALEKANNPTQKKLKEYYSGNSISRESKINEVISIFEDLDVKKETELMIESYFSKALSIFNSIKVPNEKKQTLMEVFMSMLKRSK
ncbi:MAG TPA: polyprenyl synthetase family protein [Lentimicrobium sp.]|nr:polyprenyl synthetase family protein [Lentimicrobium sp.]